MEGQNLMQAAGAAGVIPGTVGGTPDANTGTAAAIKTIQGQGTPAPAPTVPTTPFKDGVTFSEDWRQHFLPEDLRDEPSLSDYKDLPGMAKSLVSLKKMVGGNNIAIPTDSSDTAAWDAFHSAGGRPDTPGDYQLKSPEGFEFDKDTLGQYQEIFFKFGASKDLANALVNKQAEDQMGQENAAKAQEETNYIAAHKELKDELGVAFDERIRIAESVLQKYDPESSFTELKLLNNPKMVRTLIAIGTDLKSVLSEDTLGGSFKGDLTPSEIDRQILDMGKDLNGPLMNEMHPGHAAAVIARRNLIALKG